MPVKPAFSAPILLARQNSPSHLCAVTPLTVRPPLRAVAEPPAAAKPTASTPAPAASKGRIRAGHNPDALLTLGLPKGSLLDATVELMGRAGWNVRAENRSYYAKVNDDDLNLLMFRSQEMARYVGMGCVDCGICGLDWLVENDVGDAVVDVAQLNYSKVSDGNVRWVLAVPEDSPVQAPEHLAGGLVSTELLETTRKYFEERGIANVQCEFSWGATEIKARANLVDAICDVTETGDSIRANRLRVIDTVMESSTRVIANAEAWQDPARRAKIEEVVLLLDGALQGRRRVGLKMNVPVDSVDEARNVLQDFAVTSPTVSPLADSKYVSMEIITEKASERLVIPQLKALGCLGIFSYDLNMLVA